MIEMDGNFADGAVAVALRISELIANMRRRFTEPFRPNRCKSPNLGDPGCGMRL